MASILITGGTGKFGRVLIEYFSTAGYDVIFTSTTSKKITDLVQQYEERGLVLSGVNVDLAAEGGVQMVVDVLRKKQLTVNYLVNNARSLASLAINENGTTSRSNFIAEFDLDVVVPYELTLALAKETSLNLKSVVNIGSQYGTVAANPSLYTEYLKQSPIQYGVAKAALGHLTKELAVRLATKGVRVNCIAYGGVEGRVDGSFRERYAKLVPSGRMLQDSEIPGPVEFLLADASSAITGQVINADGGWTLW